MVGGRRRTLLEKKERGGNENCSIFGGVRLTLLLGLVYVDLFMKNWAQFTGDWMFSLEGEIGDIT